MRRPFVAGNWKMNLNRATAASLAAGVAERVGGSSKVDVAVCPPHVYLECVVAATKGSAVAVGAQDHYHELEGAFTGEISPAMVADIGCKYVILGHSERRNIFGESSETVNLKLKAALAQGLSPIVCVGELLEQRESGQTMSVIQAQFEGSLADLTADQAKKCVIAYEPVWAIGTGKVATPEQAEEVHADLRNLIKQRYNADVADSVRIQYGGSVKADNAAELLSQPNIDGALVGGAALKVDSFFAIVQAAG
jgi:triosephosphate isomerase